MQQPGVELAISRSQVRCPNHYNIEPPGLSLHHINVNALLSISECHHTVIMQETQHSSTGDALF